MFTYPPPAACALWRNNVSSYVRGQHTDGGGATFLYSESAPEAPRRTTLFASGGAAFDALPGSLRREAESVVVHYSNKYVTGDTATVDYISGVRMAPHMAASTASSSSTKVSSGGQG